MFLVLILALYFIGLFATLTHEMRRDGKRWFSGGFDSIREG